MGRKKPTARDEEIGPAAGVAGGKSKKKAFVIDDDEYSIGTEVSEEASVPEEKVAAVGNKKKGKKGASKKMELKDDDEEARVSEIGMGEEEEDAPVVNFAGKKKGKGKKGSSNVLSGSTFGLLGEDDEEDGNDIDEEDRGPSEPVIAFTGKKKPSKDEKSGAKFSSAFDLLDEEEENEDNDESSKEEDEVVFSGKKKSSKNKRSGGKFSSFELLDEEENEDEKSKGEDEVAFSGKKKSSKNKKSGTNFSSPFDVLDGEEESKDESSKEDDEVVFSGKKKPSKNKKSGDKISAAYDVLDVEGDNEDKNESSKEEDEIAFSGKKKPSKAKKGSAKLSSAFDLLDGEEENKDENAEDEVEIGISFTGKKKKKSSKGLKKASGNSVHDEDNEVGASVSKLEDDLTVHDGGDLEEDVPAIKFSGKKKSSKKKNVSDDTAMEEVGNTVMSSDVSKPEQHDADSKTNKQTNEVVEGNLKNKKNKKKAGKTGQEEENIDQILAEFGGVSSSKQDDPHATTSTMPPPQEKPRNQSELEDAAADKEAEGPAETAASKKKKKKKDKEKEKKAAVTEEKQEEAKNETNAKIPPGKKVPKHVREMQERLAKAREAEEKKKREEEERLRKEEEERLRQEELERLAEEKKRLKKEREKEKLLKKKQEGKLLTGKQKEEARRLEQMRKQILANAALQLPGGEAAQAPAKRPIYQKKKPKPQTQSNGAATLDSAESTVSNESQPDTPSELDAVKAESVDDVESLSAKDKSEATDENVVDDEDDEADEDDEDDEDWDAKSWDDADLKLPGKSDFADEEADSGSETLHSKEIKNTQTSSKNVDVPSVVNKPTGSENVKKKASEVDVVDKRIKKPIQTKEEAGQPSNSSDRNAQNLRSPICCIMGHVDAGKTKLLDCIRRTNVQEGEAGGITQQIGATYFPAENIRERTKELKADATLNVPGLLVIDTPGHESFTNLRTRGSGLCDIAILVVDIMHGLEPQTIESLNLLKMRNTEFIVALNKVDRLYGWKTCRNSPIVKAMKQQSKDVQLEFNMRLTQVVTQFKEQGLNTELYYKNKEMGETFSIVPTSAISGEGIPDMLLLLVQWAQKTMVQRLTYSEEVQCTVLEVKVVEGHGTTIDVVLVNGVLHEGDQIVVCGLQGPIVTSIRALLTPHPMKELRIKGTYMHHKEIKAAQGIKITAQGLEHAIAGTSLYVVKPNDDLEAITDAAMEDMQSVMSRIDKSGEGVYVQASTLGSLEALLEFLKTPEVNIPVSGISIGPVHKKDVMKASVMLEKKKEYATILAFDVKVTQESRELADELGVKIFIADIIYHLFDQFKAYINNLKEEKKREAADEAVFPSVLKIMPNCVFNKKDPIVLGVDVLEGILKIGTPICVPQKEFIEIGRIASIENNHKPVDYAKKGQRVAIKIIGSNPEEQQKMFGRHFEIEDELVSKISRNSLDALKEHYADDLTTEDKRLLFKLKRLFKIP